MQTNIHSEEEKLDAYKPTLEQLAGVKRAMLQAGVDPAVLGDAWLTVVLAAANKWTKTTPDGMAHTVNLLGFSHKSGDSAHEYELADYETGDVTSVPPHRVHFFAGAAVGGRPVNPYNIRISEKKYEKCDGCGVSTHCIKTVRDPSKDRLESLCNSCITLSDRYQIQQHGHFGICNDCPTKSCGHHPKHIPRALRA